MLCSPPRKKRKRPSHRHSLIERAPPESWPWQAATLSEPTPSPSPSPSPFTAPSSSHRPSTYTLPSGREGHAMHVRCTWPVASSRPSRQIAKSMFDKSARERHHTAAIASAGRPVQRPNLVHSTSRGSRNRRRVKACCHGQSIGSSRLRSPLARPPGIRFARSRHKVERVSSQRGGREALPPQGAITSPACSLGDLPSRLEMPMRKLGPCQSSMLLGVQLRLVHHIRSAVGRLCRTHRGRCVVRRRAGPRGLEQAA
ncbi:hypothetical protein QBC39DRAFT_94194 [Podospora conica]|nr:hypothetical protein QBC39DRAFT_94194 [Schizothecium conicum]